MDPAERRYLEDDDTPTMKTIKGATTGLVTGTIFGTIVATWYDVPRVERSVALPGLIRTLKMMGNYGVTFAAIGGVYIGVEQLLQHYRMKRDFINGAVGGFVAGSTILGYKDLQDHDQFVLAINGLLICLSKLLLRAQTVAEIIQTNYLHHNFDSGLMFDNASWNYVLLSCIDWLGHLTGKSISTAIAAGSALAVTSSLIDSGGQTTRIDTGKEYYPYTTKKRPTADS
ncbi:hypothetical protein FEM48_Zijuj12G0088600 [Ziziphus jujuba var. spinosa]|uniref:Outer envelope pore protein 16-3, chloroplastic/mitochondrial n=1 Tax=Ziziphus jujuba var. spinosa TaxID=714518 RepID=A0A978UCC3_ZIZJJ|nr:hypothetical protein FEM48_Zijuj12G0088600 [Ziziphus jujuba var. spinosa]